jgi:hypothetical protein
VKIHPRKKNQRYLNGQQILDKKLYPFKIVILDYLMYVFQNVDEFTFLNNIQ